MKGGERRLISIDWKRGGGREFGISRAGKEGERGKIIKSISLDLHPFFATLPLSRFAGITTTTDEEVHA